MGHKDWGTKESVVFFNPNQKIPCYDGMFFSPNPYWNNGNVYDFAEEDFIAGCEEAIKRFEANPVNQEGIKLRDKFTWSNTVDKILSVL
jgi:hypothetical protein